MKLTPFFSLIVLGSTFLLVLQAVNPVDSFMRIPIAKHSMPCIIARNVFQSQQSQNLAGGVTSTTKLYYVPYTDSNNDGGLNRPVEMKLQELESARAAFEALIKNQHHAMHQPQAFIHDIQQQNCTNLEERGPEDTLLTNSGRRLRELEMELLESLKESDAAIDELVHLWTTERDAEASSYLLSMQSTSRECSAGLVQEEQALRCMVNEYPSWAEPYARLATLLYYKGETHQAVAMAERAIDLKPWHFEAIHAAALLSQRNKDCVAVQRRSIRLARQALPKLNDQWARRVWVKRAVAMATQQFREAERRTQNQHHMRKARQYIFQEHDIWQ